MQIAGKRNNHVKLYDAIKSETRSARNGMRWLAQMHADAVVSAYFVQDGNRVLEVLADASRSVGV